MTVLRKQSIRATQNTGQRKILPVPKVKKIDKGAKAIFKTTLKAKYSPKLIKDLKALFQADVIKMAESEQIRSVAQSCATLCNPMNRSTPGLPVHHQRLEFTETHIHRVSDAIQPSHLLSSPSPLAHNPSQHQSLFQ